MDTETANVAYRMARSFVEWKDLAAEKTPDPTEVSMAWRRLAAEETKFRAILADAEHDPAPPVEKEPCEGCPD
jgi:hypothetical protein